MMDAIVFDSVDAVSFGTEDIAAFGADVVSLGTEDIAVFGAEAAFLEPVTIGTMGDAVFLDPVNKAPFGILTMAQTQIGEARILARAPSERQPYFGVPLVGVKLVGVLLVGVPLDGSLLGLGDRVLLVDAIGLRRRALTMESECALTMESGYRWTGPCSA